MIVLNNLGDPEDRPRFIAGLLRELEPHRDQLCRDCHRRWETNPLRIVDCKVERCRELVAATTPVGEAVSDAARDHVEAVEEGLDRLGIAVRRAPRLVRGLDYYLRTVFEVISPELGEDTVICGGGRYDRLISDLGGSQVPGIGFAIGQDRLVEVLPERYREHVFGRRPVVLLPMGVEAARQALALARELIGHGIGAQTEVTGRSLKAGLKWASKMKAAAAVIVGAEELAAGEVTIRDLDRGEQERVALDQVAESVKRLMSGPSSGRTA